MLFVSLAFAGITTPAAEPGAWTEVIQTVGLDPGAAVQFELLDQAYRVHVTTAAGERIGVVTGPHTAATREDAARLARSLLVTTADPLDALLPAPSPAPAPAPKPPPTQRAKGAAPAPVLPAEPVPEAPVAPPTVPAAASPSSGAGGFPTAHDAPEAAPTGDELRMLEGEDLPRPAPDPGPPVVAPAGPAQLPAHRSRFTLGVGSRDEVLLGTLVDGAAVSFRYAGTPTLGVELDSYVHLASDADTLASHAAELEVIGDTAPTSTFAETVAYDRLAIDVLADWSIVPQQGTWSGGPHLQVGGGARLRERVRGAIDNGEVAWTREGSAFVPALSAAFSVEGWCADRVGLRARALEHVSLEPDSGADGLVVTSALSITLDLLVRL